MKKPKPLVFGPFPFVDGIYLMQTPGNEPTLALIQKSEGEWSICPNFPELDFSTTIDDEELKDNEFVFVRKYETDEE